MNENLKVSVQQHGLLLLIAIFTLFGSGYNAIPLFSWLYFPCILIYTRHNPENSYKKILFVYLTSSLCFSFSYLGSFSTNIDTDQERFSLAWFVLVIAFTVHLFLLVPVLLADKCVLQKSIIRNGHRGNYDNGRNKRGCCHHHPRHFQAVLRIALFPMLWTGLWCLMARFGPLGDYPAFSTSIVTWPTFAQIVSVGGRSLIDFLMALFGTCTYELMVGIYQHHTTVCNTTRPLLSNVDNEEEEEAGQTANATALRAVEIKHWLLPIMIYCFILSCVLTYGGISINIRKGSFFQVNYPQYVPKTVPVGCVVGPGTDYPKLQLQQDIWFKKSASLAESGAKLIVWSELTTSVTDTEEEVKLIQKAKEFAKQHQVYLGITYAKEQPVGQNKLVLITKEGIIGIDYNKAHPVPGVESQPAGLEVLQYVDTQEFGRIGGGICFDYNFPHFISQASTHHVDVMIQPSWTWGPIGTYHQQGNILRAVENGFTLFRCVSQGVSGIFEPTLDGIFTQKVASLNVQKYLFYLPVQTRVPTMYGLFGDTFGYLCLIMSVSTLVYVLTLKRKKNKIIAGIVFESD